MDLNKNKAPVSIITRSIFVSNTVMRQISMSFHIQWLSDLRL